MSVTPLSLVYIKPSTRSSTGTKVVSHFMKKVSPPKKPLEVIVTDNVKSDEVVVESNGVLEESAEVVEEVVDVSNGALDESVLDKSVESDMFDKEGSLTPTNDIQRYDNHSLYKMIVERDNHLDALTDAQDVMANRIAKLESKVDYQQSLLNVKDCVVKALESELHRLQQYTRRYSVNIIGIPKPRGEKLIDLRKKVEDIITSTDSGITPEDIDKLHRNGPAFGADQDTIVRFKTHSAKEAFYKKRKTIQETHRKILIRPSLSPAQKSLLEDAREFMNTSKYDETNCTNPPEFVFANVHGDIQVKMKRETRQGLFVTVRSIQHLAQVIERAQDSKLSQKYHHEKEGWADDSHSTDNSDDDMGFGLFV